MTGWAGGIANREWKRDRRTPDSGRIDLIENVRDLLAIWRTSHGYRPGQVWNPRTAAYEDPGQRNA